MGTKQTEKLFTTTDQTCSVHLTSHIPHKLCDTSIGTVICSLNSPKSCEDNLNTEI